MYEEERRQNRKDKKQERLAKQRIDTAMRWLLEHKEGRDFLWHYLGVTNAIGQNPFAHNALQTSFNCGEQNVGLQLFNHILEVDPAGFLKMQQEKADEDGRRERDTDDADD